MAPSNLSFIERFRWWYEYEKDCNAKAIAMLESVPAEARPNPTFARAMGKMGHLVVARQMWLHRLGESSYNPAEWFPVWPFDELKAATAKVQEQWTAYFARLTDADLTRDFEYTGTDGKRRRWGLLNLFTQVFGHAWYHRGQVAMLVKDLGGMPVNSDFIFWDQPTILD
jgi:uncharacterized damage-inducible protein DinB